VKTEELDKTSLEHRENLERLGQQDKQLQEQAEELARGRKDCEETLGKLYQAQEQAKQLQEELGLLRDGQSESQALRVQLEQALEQKNNIA